MLKGSISFGVDTVLSNSSLPGKGQMSPSDKAHSRMLCFIVEQLQAVLANGDLN